MDELSELVKEITVQLKEQKNKLAPQIQELRTVRLAFQEVEGAYLEEKAKYDEVKLAVDVDLNKINGEVTTLQDEMNGLERKYHSLQTALVGHESRLARVNKEERVGASDGGSLQSQGGEGGTFSHSLCVRAKLFLP